ncbi:protein ALTERED PHOSPHATE STARVATION RESPONSE 1 [Impatiens glandulifera]|uniref:protein ALTERED PHOSPHATE STARVATION RESPONSE 1 n=1 Tax=Impatiens glandulifera TaxID=253017 RepID=UPI001FB109F4|nr:protein ALTERED PHOSPHATE STARVATION RESPONSE 1 [Impatiens glandulifera]
MGCAQSKIDNEESVTRCKERRNHMKNAVSARNAFASGHAGYAIALKNTGAALSDYAQGEVDHEYDQDSHLHLHHHHQPQSISTPEPQSMEPTLLRPPPLPDFSPATPLQRSATMPEFSVTKESRKMKAIAIEEDDEEEREEIKDERNLTRRSKKGKAEPPLQQPLSPIRTPEPPPPLPEELKGVAWDYFFMTENIPGPSLDDPEMKDQNEDEEFDEHFDRKIEEEEEEEEEPKTPEKLVSHGFNTDVEEETPVVVMEKHFMHSKTAPSDILKRASNRKVGSNVNLMKVLGDIDDHFLKASEAAQEVSRMLEATRMHYHSNFADNQGHIDHAARVMRVITWNKSFKGVSNGEGQNGDIDLDEHETHATILDKMLAWEKKLYEEMKAGELMKMEYQRKVAQLNKLKKNSASAESLEKTKAAVSHLHTRYIVDMQSLDSTVSEVNDIRDHQLYPKLVGLVNGMATMWESMCIHHDSQQRIVEDLKSLEVTGTPKETTKQHHSHTIQIWEVVQKWQTQFDILVTNQKQYIHSLSEWLKLNLMPIESTLKDKTTSSSPPRPQNPPIYSLLQFWSTQLEKLPDEQAKSAITSFAAVIKAIIVHQEEEMKLKEKCEETRKEYLRKSQLFDDWYQKYMYKRTGSTEDDQDSTNNNNNNPISERQSVVEILKKRWEEEMEVHQRHCLQVREKSLGSLRIRLPELFRVLSDYSHACADAYQRLRVVAESQNANGGGGVHP